MTTKNLGTEEKPIKIRLNDGIEYDLEPLDMNMMVEVEEKFEKPFAEIFRDGWVKPIRYALWLMMKDSAKMREEDLGKLITGKIITTLTKIISEQLGSEE